MQSCRQLTVPCTGCGVTSAFIDTPSSACLPESPVYVTSHWKSVTPFLCPYIWHHDFKDFQGKNTIALVSDNVFPNSIISMV